MKDGKHLEIIKVMPAEESCAAQWTVAKAICRSVRMETKKIYHLQKSRYQHFKINSDARLKALRLQAVSSNLDPA